MVILVTGATGLVGNNTTRLLVDRGHHVRVLVRGSADPRSLANVDIELCAGDVRDHAAVDRAVRGTDAVVHSAARVHIGWTGLDEARAVNVEGTRNVAAAALKAGAKLVHVSSIDALGVPTNGAAGDENLPPIGGILCPYVVTKREAEQVVLEYVEQGLDARIVNPGYVVGPYDWKPSSGRMILHIARWQGLWAPLGCNHYCHAGDVAGGILAALELGQKGRRYILGGQCLSYFEAWRVIASVTGGLPPVFPAGPLVRKGAGLFGDVKVRLTGREGDVNSAATSFAAQKRIYTSARAEAELGFRPRPFRVAVSDAWQWFRENGYA